MRICQSFPRHEISNFVVTKYQESDNTDSFLGISKEIYDGGGSSGVAGVTGAWGQTKICVPPKKMKYDNEMVMCIRHAIVYDPTCL